MFGINGGELVVLLVLAFLLIGPERLPELAQQLGRLTREVKKIATGAKEKVREELGPEFDDLAALDPRQYDPRRIVREALMEDDEPARPARPRAARRPSPAATARTGSTAAGAVAGASAGLAAGAVAAGAAAGERAGTAAAPSAPKAAPATGSTAARVAVTPPAQVLAEARTAAPTATALAEEPVPPGAEEEPYVVPFDDEAT
ncbi:twin-arginine translocase TatA/TatE family subunit [Georgenia daeguensis]|uniref:Sec-independent protein translocase protein TatB n=1 Tax=Georgenia daeguensis TaxID=908355 RepID=A0ABP8EV04_9MICO